MKVEWVIDDLSSFPNQPGIIGIQLCENLSCLWRRMQKQIPEVFKSKKLEKKIRKTTPLTFFGQKFHAVKGSCDFWMLVSIHLEEEIAGKTSLLHRNISKNCMRREKRNSEYKIDVKDFDCFKNMCCNFRAVKTEHTKECALRNHRLENQQPVAVIESAFMRNILRTSNKFQVLKKKKVSGQVKDWQLQVSENEQQIINFQKACQRQICCPQFSL